MKKIILSVLICLIAIGALSACSKLNNGENFNNSQSGCDEGSCGTEFKGPPLKDERIGDLTAFKTKDIKGEEVTQDILKDYDVTMVNVWATWCGPCVKEMPYLAKLQEKLPKNANVITICADGDEAKDLANKILDNANAKFKTLLPSEILQEKLMKNIQGYPLTFFVDKKGNAVGEEIYGAPSSKGDEIIKIYLENINKTLKEVEGK